MKLTDKEEKFTQSLFQGLSQRKAYKLAYPNSINWKDSTVDSKACTLAKKEKIMERLTELRENVAEKNSWTVEKLIKEFEDIKNKAENIAEFNNCIKSLENIGKLCGFYEDKVKHSGEIVTKINVVPARKRDNK